MRSSEFHKVECLGTNINIDVQKSSLFVWQSEYTIYSSVKRFTRKEAQGNGQGTVACNGFPSIYCS